MASRTYRCKEDTRLTKTIIATYPKGSSATKDGFRTANRFAVVEFKWDGKEDIPCPSNNKKKRVYPSVKEAVRSSAHLGGKKAAYQALKSRGGFDGAKNSSEFISRKQSYYQVSKGK